MILWWCYPGDQAGGPFDITIARAASTLEACQLLGERFPSPCVHELKAPALIAGCADLAPGRTTARTVAKLPSFYDQYRAFRGYDYAAMDRDDIEYR